MVTVWLHFFFSAYAANPICALDGIEYPGYDVVGSGPAGSIEDVGMPDNCAENCRFSSQCVAWSYRKSRYECYLHASGNQMARETGWICGDNKSSQKTDSHKYNDPNLITGNFIPGISKLPLYENDFIESSGIPRWYHDETMTSK